MSNAEVDRLRAEVDRLRAEVERLTAWHPASAVGALRMMRAEAECDALRARLAKVEALAKVQARSCQAAHRGRLQNWLDVLAIIEPALASVPDPSDSEPAPHPQFSAFMDRALENPETRAAYEAALERDSEPAPDADREAGER